MKSHLFGAISVCLFALITTLSNAAVLPTYFGWNLVYVPGNDSTQRWVWQLTNISYVGEANVGLVDPDSPYSTPLLNASMPNFPGFDVTFGAGEVFPPHTGPWEFQGIPDVEDDQWLVDNSTTFPEGGNGISTRDMGATVNIDWVPAGVSTPWGSLPFPSIGIMEIETIPYGYYDFLDIDLPFARNQNPAVETSQFDQIWYVVGLIPTGQGTELNSDLLNPQSDIYGNMVGTFFPGTGLNEFTIQLSAAAIPLPASVWLFGSGLIGLVGITRRKGV